MTPDDPRHGTNRGWAAHRSAGEPACAPCRAGNAASQRRGRKIRAMYGPRIIDATGTRRRVEALVALGWSGEVIAQRVGISQRNLWSTVRRPRGVYLSTAKKIARVYDEMSMTLPTATTKGERISVTKSRGLAARKGWAPPLAWDDIDTDPEPNYGHAPERVAGKFLPQSADDVDEVAVQRILDGDWRLPCTRADKAAVVARWTGTLNELKRRTGWKVERYVNRDPEAAA